ncbi:MAG: UvrD-helicase domain-containing protein [Paludibacteraceae bacterium]|nr:UvrD-helicase domain-containing protein [Paludibacteraceae bacterium]
MELLQDLNPSQRAAVACIEGPSLIIAGAGSGKTRVLTYKVAYLLSQGVQANRILCLTFTNKAAREMKERIIQLVSPEAAHYLWMGTFHSIAARILRQEAEHIGYTRDYSIYDTTDSKSLIKAICKEMGLDEKIYKPNVVLGRISDAKSRLETAEDYALSQRHSREDRNDRLYDMAAIYRAYEARLRSANAMDFDDLLLQLCLLLQRDAEVRSFYQQAFEYILVDEYQDTNQVQSQLVQLLAAPQNNVSVVGDDAQSIYSFRGADIRNILSFRQIYPTAQLFKLERNYRSTQTIVNAANSLIHHNVNQIEKQVYSENEQGDRLRLTAYMSDRDEAAGVAEQIKSLRLNHTIADYNSLAVLYRTNAQSRQLENELRKLNIPYRIYGGTSFYQRKEIKDAIGYFRLAVNPKDTEALNRIINFPARGIGDTTLRRISELSLSAQVSPMEIIADPAGQGLDVNRGIQSKLLDFSRLMKEIQEAMDTQDAYTFAEFVLRRSGVMTAAAMDITPEGMDRKENLDELLSGIHEFVAQRQQEGIDFTPIQDFLAEVSLLTDQDEHIEDYTARVTLMTVHAAKGLEFPYVFIVGLEENLFPSQFSTSESEVEEERRLLYVAITRAMQHCSLTYARQRFRNGQINFSSPSRFLRDIDPAYVTHNVPPATCHLQPATRNLPPASRPLQPVPCNLQPAPRNLSPLQDTPFKGGDIVSHRVFGRGVVQQVYRENDNDKIDILFDAVGKKTLLLTYAKLEKV